MVLQRATDGIIAAALRDRVGAASEARMRDLSAEAF
jgi:hypothetical protein